MDVETNHIRTLNTLKSLDGIVELDRTLKSQLRKYPGVKGHSNIDDALLEGYDDLQLLHQQRPIMRSLK